MSLSLLEEVLEREYSIRKELNKMHSGLEEIIGDTGTPGLYVKAYYRWQQFLKYYSVDMEFRKDFCYPFKKLDDRGNEVIPKQWEGAIPPLDIFFDIAPKVFDTNFIEELIKTIEKMKLRDYPLDKVKNKIHMAEFYFNFYNKYITLEPTKQTDLVSIFNEIYNGESSLYFSDPKWLFYVWRQFGIVNVEKRGRYNFIWKNPDFSNISLQKLVEESPSYEVLFAEEISNEKEREGHKFSECGIKINLEEIVEEYKRSHGLQ